LSGHLFSHTYCIFLIYFSLLILHPKVILEWTNIFRESISTLYFVSCFHCFLLMSMSMLYSCTQCSQMKSMMNIQRNHGISEQNHNLALYLRTVEKCYSSSVVQSWDENSLIFCSLKENKNPVIVYLWKVVNKPQNLSLCTVC
jgi:hypothetical protein